jgi:hypothetical protein
MGTGLSVAELIDNPYVGPRTFKEEQQDLFFGREREAKDLLSLVLAERLVLFYAQSGAGKSSLINTRLRPNVKQEGFVVLPVGRVRGNLPADVSNIANIFAFNLILSLDQGHHEASTLAQSSLHDYLRLYAAEIEPGQATPETPYLLIIDQFEEILTTNLKHWPKREDFFKQVGQAINNDPLLWVMLTVREDYVAPLEPYARFLPGRLRTRFYMRRLSYKAALEAVERPAEKGGRLFAPNVAQNLVDNLRRIRPQSQTDETYLDEFVEPVQLQVVCYQLWENLRKRPRAEKISDHDLAELGNVDTALAQFYEQVLVETIQQTGITEIDLRDWFERQLITEVGTRSMVYRGEEQTGGLPTQVIDFVAGKFLLRPEVRVGSTWYELAHDRFIQPILSSNQVWRLQQPLIQLAQEWVDAGQSESKLLDGQQLTEALTGNWKALGAMVAEFLEASQVAQQVKEATLQAEREAQRQRELEAARQLAKEAEARHQAEAARAQEAEARQIEQTQAAARLRRRALWLAGVTIVAVVLALIAFWFFGQAELRREEAVTAQAAAETSQADALAAQKTAEARREEAVTAQAAAETSQADALAAQKTAEARREQAISAQAAAETSQTNALAAQATAETDRKLVATTLAQQVANLQNQLSGESANKATLEARLLFAQATQTAIAALAFTPTPTPSATPTPTRLATATPTPVLPSPIPLISPTPTSTPPPIAIIAGRLAIPIDNGFGKYDVIIYSMTGQQLVKIGNAHQPNFRVDGSKLLVKTEGESIWEVDSTTGQNGRPVSSSGSDEYPFYNPDGTRLVYGNPQLIRRNGDYRPYIFVQCALVPPQQETTQICSDPFKLLLIAENADTTIQGSHPVWTWSDQIVYQGCNLWAGGGACGLFMAPSWITGSQGSQGQNPSQLPGITDSSATPTDAHGDAILYQSNESGNWEVYLTSTKGGSTNLSSNPASDGMATFSPGGQAVAFVSNRSGNWAVWQVAVTGGEIQKLFDLPAKAWGTGSRDWTNERMSWGP